MAALAVTSKRLGSKDVNAYFIRLIFRSISAIIAIIVILQGGQHLGIPLATLLAGAGVGGLAVALAAQDMLKNLFGSMMIVLDKPYQVSERIIAKGHDGFVEEIGLRSTKIRLLNGHLVSIPNEDMARSDIENVGRRQYIRRVTSLKLPLDTPIVKLEKAVTLIRDILQHHGVTDPERPPRIRFNEFNPDSFNILIFMWFSPPDWGSWSVPWCWYWGPAQATFSAGVTGSMYVSQPTPLDRRSNAYSRALCSIPTAPSCWSRTR